MMNRRMIFAVLGVVVSLWLLSGCDGPGVLHNTPSTQTPGPLAEISTSPLSTPQPTESATSTSSPTVTAPPTEAPTSIPTPESHPTPEWTPYEGEPFTVVYQRCGELFVSEVGGQGERPLTNEDMGTSERPCLGVSSFSVSPDGQRVAYVVSAEHDNFVKVMSLLDGTTRVVGSMSEPHHVYIFERPMWWDDTHIAYYICEPPPTEEDDTIQMKELVVVDLETGESTVEPFSAFQYPSPDGRYVLSGHSSRDLDPSCQLYQLYDHETGEQWVVIDEDTPAGFMGWSPEGRLALFILIVEEESEVESEIERLLVVDAEMRVQRLVSPEDKVAYGPGAAWSPDGQTIAYRQCDPPPTFCGNPELWLTSPNGANRHRIPMEGSIHCEHISWTPDSSRLVFETTREPSIWSVRLDGTDLRPVAHGYKPQVLPAP